MNINWKQLAKSSGYKSLKKAYVYDINTSGRSKDYLYKHFQWVINRAKHYADNSGKSIEHVLTEWEHKRSYWWLNFYQGCNQPKYHSGSKKPMGIKGTRSYYKKSRFYDLEIKKRRVMEFIQFEQKKHIDKERKPRWSMARKKRGY